MPYIKKDERAQYRLALRESVFALAGNPPGHLNYFITELLRDYTSSRGGNYTAYNEAVGALECAKLELYRRMVAPYEDTKIQENGDVYQ